MRFALFILTLLFSQFIQKSETLRQANTRASVLNELELAAGASHFVDVEQAEPASSANSYDSSMPRKFQCYSCMSLSYQNNWERLQHLYVQPKIFTDRCEHPGDFEKMPTVECGSVCVSLVEADVEGGVFLGFKYIRGCINRVLMHDFNLSALRTHRFTQVLFGADLCRSLPRTVLFNNPRMAPQVFGEVNLCTCFGDKCNSASQSATSPLYTPNFGLILLALLLLSRTF